MKKIILNSAILNKAIKIAALSIGKNSVLPVIEKYLVKAENGQLYVETTDLNTYLSFNHQTAVDMKVEEFAFMLPVKVTRYLSTLEEQPITISSLNEDFTKIEIKSDNGTLVFNTEEVGNFIKKKGGATDSFFKTTNLPVVLKTMLPFVSNDDLRPALTAVQMELSENAAKFVATDAHTLRAVDVKGIGLHTEMTDKVLMPKKLVAVLTKLSAFKITEVYWDLENIWVKLYNEKTPVVVTVHSKIEDAKFPNWQAILPVIQNYEILLKRKEFIAAIKSAETLSNDYTRQVVLKFTKDGGVIIIDNVDESVDLNLKLHDVVYVGTAPEKFVIGFNARLLLRVLEYNQNERFSLCIENANRATVIKNEIEYNLIMPVMLNSEY